MAIDLLTQIRNAEAKFDAHRAAMLEQRETVREERQVRAAGRVTRGRIYDGIQRGEIGVRVTPAMRRVLEAIRDGRPWRASAETVEAVLTSGLANYDADGVWSLTGGAK